MRARCRCNQHSKCSRICLDTHKHLDEVDDHLSQNYIDRLSLCIDRTKVSANGVFRQEETRSRTVVKTLKSVGFRKIRNSLLPK